MGLSKLGADTKVKIPVPESIQNLSASEPPEMEYVRAFPSASVAVTVVTAVLFSGTLNAPPEVIVGAVLTGAGAVKVNNPFASSEAGQVGFSRDLI
jgi:hypothetical protein